MRLLNVDESGNLTLTKDLNADIPGYAILSHTWGSDDDELTMQDVVAGRGRDKPGYKKIEFCKAQAASDNIRYFWIDTCCIDKTNSTELSQAINSMFRWYQSAIKCYVYLSGVSSAASSLPPGSFTKSRWFTRGWTLQELVAPRVVEFFASDGSHIGRKESLTRHIEQATGIQPAALYAPLSDFSLEDRMLWAKGRTTKLEEDRVYSMLGIFQVHLPLIYGEGARNAFIRLQEAVEKKQAFDSSLTRGSGNVSSLYRLYIRSGCMSDSLPGPQSHQLEYAPIQPKALTETEKECLRSLRFPAMDHRRLSLASPAKGTCSWLFEHNKYQPWFCGGREDQYTHGDLLLLTGKPGVGKSVLMKEAFRRASTGKHKSPYRTAAFFFNAKGDPFEHSTIGLYRSLLVQLLPKSPKHLQRACELRDEQAWGDSWPEVQLESILRLMFDDPSEPITFLFIDEVDECDDGSRSQLEFWRKITESTEGHVNVCISKRHFPYVGSGKSPIIGIKHHNRKDLARYVEQRLEFGMAAAGSERNFLKQVLLDKSKGVFLWAVLTLDAILAEWDEGRGTQSLLKLLDEVPSGLSDLFSHMLGSLDSTQRPLTLRFFQWATLAKPLRVYEWHHIMAFIREPVPLSLREWRSSNTYTETEEQLERMIKSVSLGLVEVKTVTESEESHRYSMDSISICAGAGSLDLERGESRVVQFIHESVRQYFLGSCGFNILESSLSAEEYLLKSGRFDIPEVRLSDEDSVNRGHMSIMHTCLDYINIEELDALIKARKTAQDEKERLSRAGLRCTISDPSDQAPNINQAPDHALAADPTRPNLALPARAQSSTSHWNPELVNAKRAHCFPQSDRWNKRSKASSEPRRGFSENPAQDAFDAEDIDEVVGTEPSVDIIAWLEAQSTDSRIITRKDSEDLPCVPSRASSATGQVLEDYPALLSYALTHFFSHARLADSDHKRAPPDKIIDRLLEGDWDRWVALSEEVFEETSLYDCAQSRNLRGWNDYLERIDAEGANSQLSSHSDSRNKGIMKRPVYKERRESVASFSSASSHASECARSTGPLVESVSSIRSLTGSFNL